MKCASLWWEYCTPLHVASAHGNTELVLLLLESGADVGAGKGSQTPLYLALRLCARFSPNRPRNVGDLVPTVRALLSYGANALTKDGDGDSTMDFALAYPDIDFLRLFDIHTLDKADADALESLLRTQWTAPESLTWPERERRWICRFGPDKNEWLKYNQPAF